MKLPKFSSCGDCLEFALLACCFARCMVPCLCLRFFLLLVDVMFVGVLIIYLDFISFALLCLFSYSICFPYMGPLSASTAKGPVGH